MLVNINRRDSVARFVMLRDEYTAICEAQGIDDAGLAGLVLSAMESEAYIKQKHNNAAWFQMSLNRLADKTHGLAGRTRLQNAVDALIKAGFILSGTPPSGYLRATFYQFCTDVVQAAVDAWISEDDKPKDPPPGPKPDEDDQPEPESEPLTLEIIRERMRKLNEQRETPTESAHPFAHMRECIDVDTQMHLRVCGNPFAATRQSNIYKTPVNGYRGKYVPPYERLKHLIVPGAVAVNQ